MNDFNLSAYAGLHVVHMILTDQNTVEQLTAAGVRLLLKKTKKLTREKQILLQTSTFKCSSHM